MNVEEYILAKLDELLAPSSTKAIPEAELEAEIVRLILSKKFRKYAISVEQIEHIKSAVHICVTEQKPIQATLVFGGYKLWRLDESPETDWAELFSIMYYTKWMKPVCEIYKPGVWFDFYSDDVIVPYMNNVPTVSTACYQHSFKKLLNFVKPYQPANLNMTLNRVGDQYASYDEFMKEVQEITNRLKDSLKGGLPVVDENMKATILLNVNVTTQQLADPQWVEKVQLTHDAYAQVSKRRPYYRTADKFNIFTTHFPGGLSVGTTKDSIMKWWIGAGVLKAKGDSYRQLIYSPNQLNSTGFEIQSVNIPGLDGKNYATIRIEK